MLPEIDHHLGIEIAGAGAHHEPSGGAEPHRRVQAPAVPNRRHAAATPEVGHDEPRRELRRWTEGGEGVDDGLAGKAVEAVANDAPDSPATRQSVPLGDGRHRPVEGGIETGYLQ